MAAPFRLFVVFLAIALEFRERNSRDTNVGFPLCVLNLWMLASDLEVKEVKP
jgi:hypothetical protein